MNDDAMRDDWQLVQSFVNKTRKNPSNKHHPSIPDRLRRIIFDTQCILTDIADEGDPIYKKDALTILHSSCTHAIEMIEDFDDVEFIGMWGHLLNDNYISGNGSEDDSFGEDI